MSFELILPFFPEELRALLQDDSISDLMINGTTGVFADRGGVVGHIALSAPYANDRLQAAIERVARILGQDLTGQNPILNTRLPDGSRVAVVGAPSSINGPTLTVRKFNRWYTSDQLVEAGSFPQSVRDDVVELIRKRKNGIISGGTGSGKSTLMKALLDHVPMDERLVVIEQPAELKIAHPNAVRWEAVAAIPGQVAVTPSQLVAAALRHRPDRIIMGEIRDESGYDLLQAMNTGHGGTMATLHADSAVDALDRLADMALSARTNLDQTFVRSQTGRAVDFVLHCERDHKGRRRVRELITVSGYSHAEQRFLTEDKDVSFDPKEMRHFDHGYAVTSHSSQGLTSQRVLVNMDTDVHSDLINARFAYVSVSRASHDAQVFTNDASNLAERLSADMSKTSALDFGKHAAQVPSIATTQPQLSKQVNGLGLALSQ